MSSYFNNVAERIENSKSREGGFTLIVLAIVMIVIAGFLSNEMVVYGYSSITPNTGEICTTSVLNYFPDQGCALVGPAYNVQDGGCNGVPTNCEAHEVSFIAPNTPLYYLFVEKNPIAFLESLFSGSEQSNTYQIGSTICIPLIANSSGILLLSNSTGSGIQNFECYGNVAYDDIQPPTVSVGMASSNSGNDSIWTLTGCPYALNESEYCGITGNPPELTNDTVTPASATFYGFYISNGTSISSTTCSIAGVSLSCGGILGKLLNDMTFTCPDTDQVNPIDINATTYYCLIPVANPSALSENSTGNSFGFFAVLTGLIMIIIGLGAFISFSVVGSGTSMGSNPQGTKLAQHWGIGIFVFGIFDALFGSGLLLFNNVFPGLGDLMFSLAIILYFFGLWEVL